MIYFIFLRVIKEAIAQGVMRATIDKSIKSSQKSSDVEGMFEVRGPGRTGIIVEMIGSNQGNMSTLLNTILKKQRKLSFAFRIYLGIYKPDFRCYEREWDYQHV